MINGAHVIIYSKEVEADRAFIRDVLKFTSVDVGGGWLIFGLPASEVAVHPSEENDVHQLYLMCDDVEAFVADMRARGIACAEIKNQGWGLLSDIALPGGGKLGVYEPRHARPAPMGAPKAPKKAAKKPAKKAAKKPAKKAAKRPARKAAKKPAKKAKKATRKR